MSRINVHAIVYAIEWNHMKSSNKYQIIIVPAIENTAASFFIDIFVVKCN